MKATSFPLPPQMEYISTKNGIATFEVKNEFEVLLTLDVEQPTLPWKILFIKIFVGPSPESREGNHLSV